jgi:PAS domain S-box-containing protein
MTVLLIMWGKAVAVRIRARRVFALGTVLASLLLVALPCALALDPERRISQYAHSAWRVRDGAFAGAPTSITQTTDGYVWIGTFAGLVRFDGVRFVPFAPPAGQHLPTPAVISLLGATDGSLWIGTGSGLAQWRNGDLVNFPETAGRVNSIYEDSDGTIWIARSRTNAGGVCRIASSVATCYSPKDGVPPHAAALIKDSLGYFLIGTDTALVRWKPGSSTSYELPGLKSKPGLSGISDLALAPDGTIWVGIFHSGHGLGLQKWVNGSWKTLITPTFDSSRLVIGGLQLDRHSALWIATEQTGIYRIHDGNVDHFTSADGLSSDSVGSLFEDREGNLWLTTSEGVDCFRGMPVISFSVREGLSADAVASILAVRDGTVWMGNHGELNLVRGDVVSSLGPKQGLRGNRVTALFEDHTGRLWVGVDNRLVVYEHGRFTPVHRPDGSPVGIVLAMTEDVDHNVWASVIRTPPGRPTKLICFRDGRLVKEISDLRLDAVSLAADPQSGFWLGLTKGGLARYRNDQVQIFSFKDTSAWVNQVLANSDGSVLAATNRGLAEQRGDSQRVLDEKNGLPCNGIYALITDKHSDLWLYAACGLIRIKSDDLQRWREHPDLKVKFDLFDAFDGAQPYLPPFRPIATRSNDGRLWFANDTVAQMIDPDGLLKNPIPPPVHIEDVIADRKTYTPQNGLHLPALTRDLEIDYTALSFVVPQKVHFQYKLEGYDRDWQDAGTRRQAFYSNLPPRSYTFRVKACNNSGLWNEAGASLDFFVAPAFYQTIWFRSVGVFLFLAVLTGLFRLRLRHLERQRDALRKSEQELRDVIDTIPATVWSTLPGGSNTYVNKHFVEYSGLSAEQTGGAGWQAAIHPDDLQRHAGRWMESVATGKPHENEVRFRRSDGEYRWHLDRGVPLRDEDGNIVKWYGVVTDIEDRKRAEETLGGLSRDLQESNARLEEAQSITHVGYWERDLTTDRIVWSDETYRIYGLRPQEDPIDLAVLRQKIHPEDWKLVSQALDEALGGGVRYNIEYRVLRPTGELRVVHSTGDVKRDSSGRPCQMFGTVQDITDRKRAEEALQQSQLYLIEGQRLARMGSWAFNANGFTYWSSELFQIHGLHSHDKPPTVEKYLALVHPEDRAFVKTGITQMLANHRAFDFTKRIVRPDGEIRHIRCVGIPVAPNGTFQSFLGTAMDVTEQERLTEELRLNERYLSEGQRLAHMGSWAFNPAGFFAYWSEELFHIYGLDPQTGAPTLEQYLATIHPHDRGFMAGTIKRMIAEHSGCDVRKRIICPDGKLRYIRCVGIPVVEGEVLKGFLGTAMDITEQELLTRELERRQAYLAEAQRLTHTGSWAINIATDEHFWSEEIFRIYEFDPKLKPTWSLVRDRVHPDDRASLDQQKKMEFTQTDWADSEAEYRIVLPDGRIKHLHTIAHPVRDTSGRIVEIIGTTMDITERKQVEDSLRRSESHLAEAQKLTHTGSWAWRLTNRDAAHLSEEWYRIYDFDPAEGAPTWEEYFKRIHPEDRLKLRNTIELAIVEKADYDLEFRILLPNGMVKWIHTVGHPVVSEAGELEQFAGSSTDITKLKSAEQEREKLRQLEADLAHIDRVSTLGEMAASLAHEIKQPIAAAITSANTCIEWLAHDPPNLDRARAAAARIDKYGNRAAEIIDHIRSFYKKSPPQRELVDVNEIIAEMLTLLKDEAYRFSVSMRADLSAELPKIMVDRVQLQQVFMNLMLNAIEAMADSGGELELKSELQDGQLQFSVSDTGVGLQTEKMEHIFSAFFTTKPQGSGMGLAISRSIVESHGGRLWATANDGRGATFHFTLPIQITESSVVA